MKRDGLSPLKIFAYSVSHFNNDLCASMWFVYFSWYLSSVINLNQDIVGLSILSGQIADGICTSLVGFLSDKINTRFGKRMPWYFLGTILVIPTFFGIFSSPSFVNQKDSYNN
jgi:glycoside/pentoside/hexuronide:cation symporter, GPH family